MRVLACDPGLTRCGLGVVDAVGGRSVEPVAVGVVRTPSDDEIERRLLRIATEVDEWLDRFAPDVVAIERVFHSRNTSTSTGTAQVTGVIALGAARRGLRVYFHTPTEVKAAVTGSGTADKAQVTGMITRILGLETAPRPADAADALALAVAHCWRAPIIDRIEAARVRAGAGFGVMAR